MTDPMFPIESRLIGRPNSASSTNNYNTQHPEPESHIMHL